MKITTPNLFSFEISITFKETISKSQIAESFEKLFSIKIFDGVKQVGPLEAKLTSSDLEYTLKINKKRLSVEFENMSLDSKPEPKISAVNQIANEAYSVLGYEAKSGLVDYVIFSPLKKDKDAVVNEIFSESYAEKIGAYHLKVGIDSQNEHHNKYIIFSSSHTIGMHKAFENANKKSVLKKLSSMYVYDRLDEDGDASEIGNILNYDPITDLSNVLGGLENGSI